MRNQITFCKAKPQKGREKNRKKRGIKRNKMLRKIKIFIKRFFFSFFFFINRVVLRLKSAWLKYLYLSLDYLLTILLVLFLSHIHFARSTICLSSSSLISLYSTIFASTQQSLLRFHSLPQYNKLMYLLRLCVSTRASFCSRWLDFS